MPRKSWSASERIRQRRYLPGCHYQASNLQGAMFVSFLGVLVITLVVFFAVYAVGRLTLGQ